MRTKQRSIGWLMGAVFVFAIGLTIAHGGPEVEWLASYWVLLATVMMAVSWAWFVYVPQKSLKLAGGNRDRQRRLLESVLKTPWFAGMKVHVGYILAANYQVAKRYAEAEALYRLILKDNRGNLEPGFESFIRQNLADTIEALGQREEAESERERAAKILPREDSKVLSHQAQGKLLDRAFRYTEAINAYERALSVAPPGPNSVRTTIMMHLVLSSNHAGRAADTIRWAEALIALDPRGAHSDGARRMAALGHGNMGQLDEAERHLRLAIERAETPDKRVEPLAHIARLALRQGRLDEAERTAREADSLLPGKHPIPWLIISQVARARGRLEEAVTALEYASTIEHSHIPAQNRRLKAGILRELAPLHAEMGRADTALALICEAEIEFAGDRKEEVKVAAAAALVHAFRQERDLAIARVDAACEGRTQLLQDHPGRQGNLLLIIRACLEIDETERAEALLHEFLENRPDPISYPAAYFHLAECRRRAGDAAGARDLDIKAASADSGTRWEQLARERLAAESAVPS